MMLTSGTLLQNRYRVRRQIGGGGMGCVYLVEDTRLSGRQCAIKEMSPAELAPSDRNWSIQAFRQEAQMLANLDHRGLTRVTDFFPEGGNWYLVMDFVAGETLEARLMRAPEGHLPIDRALHITRQLCDVLTYLHNRQPPVIFRDLKPGNIMLTPNDEVKLIDFGIARFFKPGKTQDTVLLGTPGYAAPEQYGGLGQSDPRTDVYSLGALLHHMVTGYNPTQAPTPFPLPHPQSTKPEMPSYIAEVISRATQPRSESRYESVTKFKQALFPPTYPLPGQPPSQSSYQHPSDAAQAPNSAGAATSTGISVSGILSNSTVRLGIILSSVLLLLCSGGALLMLVSGTIEVDDLGLSRSSASTEMPTERVVHAEKTTEPVPTTEATWTARFTETPQNPTPTLTSPPSPTIDREAVLRKREETLLTHIRYREGNGEVLWAYRATSPPILDGSLDEWTPRPYPFSHVVHSQEDSTWQGADDLYGYGYLAWDDGFLYLGVQVTDDVHVQTETGETIFRGDEVEIQVDTKLSEDFNDDSLSDDDIQIGFSPGDLFFRDPEVYIWRPESLESSGTMIELAARETGEGYVLETAIPWWVLQGRPPTETPIGFTVNVSDNDNPKEAQQMRLLSNSPNRKWGDPTTWGTLILVDWEHDETP